MPYDSEDKDSHVVNEFWLPEFEKWAMIDIDMGRHYISDTSGKPLSISEIRNCLILDERVIVYSGFQEPCFEVNEYYAYLTKNMYWFSRWGDFVFLLRIIKLFRKQNYGKYTMPSFQLDMLLLVISNTR